MCGDCFPVLVLLASLLQQALAPRDIEEMLEVGHTVTSWGTGGPFLLHLDRILIAMPTPDMRFSYVFIDSITSFGLESHKYVDIVPGRD